MQCPAKDKDEELCCQPGRLWWRWRPQLLLNMPTPDSVVGAKACISGSLLQEVALHFAPSLTAHRVIQMAPDYATKDGTLAHLHAVLFTHCSWACTNHSPMPCSSIWPLPMLRVWLSSLEVLWSSRCSDNPDPGMTRSNNLNVIISTDSKKMKKHSAEAKDVIWCHTSKPRNRSSAKSQEPRSWLF